MPNAEPESTGLIKWLSDAALAADFGLISTASLVVGVACADTERRTVLMTALAVICSGAFSIAAENYLSVASEADRERAELARRRQLIDGDARGEPTEGEPDLPASEPARPLHAAFAAAVRFVLGGTLPLLVVIWAPRALLVPLTVASSLTLLALLGATAARADGANEWKAVARSTFWGALAMGATALEGLLFGAAM
jgi:VIT1/CCC1 family predicted Fe2+/Mn2+ transporter